MPTENYDPIPLIDAAQTVTSGWVDLGLPVDMSNFSRLALWLVLDINDSQNVRIRALPKLGKNDTQEYNYVIESPSATDIELAPSFYELSSDTDQAIVWQINTLGLVPYVQFQVMAGTVGATAADIESAQVFRSRFIN